MAHHHMAIFTDIHHFWPTTILPRWSWVGFCRTKRTPSAARMRVCCKFHPFCLFSCIFTADGSLWHNYSISCLTAEQLALLAAQTPSPNKPLVAAAAKSQNIKTQFFLFLQILFGFCLILSYGIYSDIANKELSPAKGLTGFKPFVLPPWMLDDHKKRGCWCWGLASSPQNVLFF